MKKPERDLIRLEECRRRVRVDLEYERGITDTLQNLLSPEMLALIASARAELEPVIEMKAEALHRWHHR